MTTVLKPGEPMRDNTHITLVSDDGSHAYGRPTAGNNAPTVANADGGAGVGPPATDSDAPAGVIPDSATAYGLPPGPFGAAGAVSVGDTLAGPDMGAGATIVVGDSGDRPSGATGVGPGTVGSSLNQGITQLPSDVRDDFPKGPDLP